MSKAIAFTGRRPKDLCGYDKNAYTGFIDQLSSMLKYYYDQGYDKFNSGLAQGFDMLAFHAVDKLKQSGAKIQNVVYMPFKGQELRWAKYGTFSQDEYRRIIDRADDVKVLCNNADTSDYRAVTRLLDERNHAMVDDADLVLALYPDGNWFRSKGGTANCMRYARTRHVPVHRIGYAVKDGRLVITNCTVAC